MLFLHLLTVCNVPFPCDDLNVCLYQVRVITVFTVFRLLTDFVCLYTYEFSLSLRKIVRSSVILLLPLFNSLTLKKRQTAKTYSSPAPVLEPDFGRGWCPGYSFVYLFVLCCVVFFFAFFCVVLCVEYCLCL